MGASSSKQKNDEFARVLLVGAPGSGKTTFVKQLKIAHAGGAAEFTADEKKVFKKAIIKDAFVTIQTAVNALAADLELENAENKKTVADVKAHKKVDNLEALPFADKIKPLFADAVFRKTSKIEEENPEFLELLERITDKDYTPANKDILLAYIPTKGHHETPFTVESVSFKVVDVGGNEQKVWQQQYNNANVLVYFVNVSQFDTPHLEESLQVFGQTVNTKPLANKPIVLALSKFDLFVKKVPSVHLNTTFKDYNGPQAVDEYVNFIVEKFKAADKHEGELRVHVVTTSIENAENSIATVKKLAGEHHPKNNTLASGSSEKGKGKAEDPKGKEEDKKGKGKGKEKKKPEEKKEEVKSEDKKEEKKEEIKAEDKKEEVKVEDKKEEKKEEIKAEEKKEEKVEVKVEENKKEKVEEKKEEERKEEKAEKKEELQGTPIPHEHVEIKEEASVEVKIEEKKEKEHEKENEKEHEKEKESEQEKGTEKEKEAKEEEKTGESKSVHTGDIEEEKKEESKEKVVAHTHVHEEPVAEVAGSIELKVEAVVPEKENEEPTVEKFEDQLHKEEKKLEEQLQEEEAHFEAELKAEEKAVEEEVKEIEKRKAEKKEEEAKTEEEQKTDEQRAEEKKEKEAKEVQQKHNAELQKDVEKSEKEKQEEETTE